MEKRIYLTIDVECHDINRRNQYIDGIYRKGDCGLKHILDLSKEMNIPVNCFVDIPEVNKYGEGYMKGIIELIHSYNQHIYLHLHPNYITNNDERSFLWEYSKKEKEDILSTGFDLYQKYIGHRAEYFRVGRYGADKEMYRIIDNMGYSLCDLSFCSNCHKMCHISSDDLGTINAPTIFEGQLILPNTRYVGLKIKGREVFVNLDASDTTFNEFKKVIKKASMPQFVFTMHSWNFIKKYFFLKNYVTIDKYEEKKFRRMVDYARSQGYEFYDLHTTPPINIGKDQDGVIDLYKNFTDYPSMIINNFIRFFRIGRLNPKYFFIYGVFFITLFFLVVSIIVLLLK